MGKAHGMLSVIGLDDKTMEDVCSKARTAVGGGTVCQIANYLFPTGRVVSGHKSALDEACLPSASKTRTIITVAVDEGQVVCHHGDGGSLQQSARCHWRQCHVPDTNHLFPTG